MLLNSLSDIQMCKICSDPLYSLLNVLPFSNQLYLIEYCLWMLPSTRLSDALYYGWLWCTCLIMDMGIAPVIFPLGHVWINGKEWNWIIIKCGFVWIVTNYNMIRRNNSIPCHPISTIFSSITWTGMEWVFFSNNGMMSVFPHFILFRSILFYFILFHSISFHSIMLHSSFNIQP
jgi:hypothetical protein